MEVFILSIHTIFPLNMKSERPAVFYCEEFNKDGFWTLLKTDHQRVEVTSYLPIHPPDLYYY